MVIFSVSSFLQYDYINFHFPYENEYRESIYACLREPPLLTVIIGAKCYDGVVLIADKKLTNIFGGRPEFRDKIYGDLAHFPMGYTGLEEVFNVFRKSVVGEWLLKLDTNPLPLEEVIPTYASAIRVINEIASKRQYSLEILIGKHLQTNTELYHIHANGLHDRVAYFAIGSGKETADRFCQSLPIDTLTMKEFVKHAYFAIMFMNQYCPGLGVGMEPDGIPMIRYLDYNKDWDCEPPKEDKEYFKKYSDEKLEELKQTFDRILKE